MGHRSPHSPRSAEQLIAGRAADPADARLAGLLDGLRVGPLECELEHEERSVALLAATIAAAEGQPQTSSRRRRPMPTRLRVTIAGALAAGALAATSGLAFAGALPGAAQDTAASVLSHLGISVPGPNSHAGTHPDARGHSTDAPSADNPADETGTGGSASDEPQPSDNGKGSTISKLAHTTTATGRDKGEVISTAASGGKSHAGNPPGQSQSGPQGGSTSHTPPTPDHSTGGTGTADEQSGGHDSQGSSTAGSHSGGHSSAGSGNAGSHGPN